MTIAVKLNSDGYIGKTFANEGFYFNTLQVATYTCRKVCAFNGLLPLILSESMYRTISRQKVNRTQMGQTRTNRQMDIDFQPKKTCVRNFRNSLFQKGQCSIF